MILVLPSSSNNCIVCAQSSYHFTALAFCFILQVMTVLIVLEHFCDSSAPFKQQQLHCLCAIFLSFCRPCILFYSASCGVYWLFWSTSVILGLPLSSNNCVVCARPSYHMYMFPVIFHLWCLLTDRYWFSLYLPCVLPYTSKWGLVCFSLLSVIFTHFLELWC